MGVDKWLDEQMEQEGQMLPCVLMQKLAWVQVFSLHRCHLATFMLCKLKGDLC